MKHPLTIGVRVVFKMFGLCSFGFGGMEEVGMGSCTPPFDKIVTVVLPGMWGRLNGTEGTGGCCTKAFLGGFCSVFVCSRGLF